MPAVEPPHDAPGQPPPGAAARRSRPIYRVFVSSTWLDLQPERKALMEALNRMEEMRFVGMEFFGNRPDDTHDASIDQVDLCEVFVGIIGHRYGSGITEAEYRRARVLNLPCFVYFKRGTPATPEQSDNDPALAARLGTFKRDLLRDHTVKEFERPEELAANATADLHNWVAARWIVLETEPAAARPRSTVADADRTNALRLLERVDQDWVKGVLEASLHHRAWLELGLDWREDAVEHPWDRIVVAPDRPIQTLRRQDSITGVFDAAQHTLLVLGEPGAGKTTTVLELARDLIARARESAAEPSPVVLALSTWRGQHRTLLDWLVAELGLRYQVPKRVARAWLEEGRLVLILDGLDEVVPERRAACVAAINAFQAAHPPPGLAVTCRVAEYDALTVKLRLRSAICLQPLTAEQIDRYFKAAGTGLDPLRAALRDDPGLRELARSPLMLSVMTMAWREAPAGTAAPFAAARTPEELRRKLFDAYVEAALKRRGKAASAFSSEQTVSWLTWLARRMKESGHTLFAVEQLQPGWLAGAGSQGIYFLLTRCLGCLAIVVPFLCYHAPPMVHLAGAILALGVGLAYGLADFLVLRSARPGVDLGSRRFWVLVATTLLAAVGWVWGLLVGLKHGADGYVGYGMSYLVMVAFAFCAPVDLRTLDIKPSDSMRWSWRLALERFFTGIVALNVPMALIFAVAFVGIAVSEGWRFASHDLRGLGFVAGVITGAAGGVYVGLRRWRKGRMFTVALAVAGMSLGGQVGTLVTQRDPTGFVGMVLEFSLAAFIGVFGGFVSGMIDPTRARRSGAWFWLRVPMLAFVVVGLLMTIPGAVAVVMNSPGRSRAGPQDLVVGSLVVGAACGLVAFFRFGGFNGLQHGVLRVLLVRDRSLPPKAGEFLDQAAGRALLQKVGFGYRFVHALLLDHFAEGGKRR